MICLSSCALRPRQLSLRYAVILLLLCGVSFQALFSQNASPPAQADEPPAASGAQDAAAVAPPPETPRVHTPLFPAAYFTDYTAASSRFFSVETEAELAAAASSAEVSLLLNNDVLAFYGHPHSRNMGILGRYPKEQLDALLTKLAGEYEEAGGRRVQKAFYLIYGTVWPGGEIGVLSDRVIREYIEYALDHGLLVFLDHQIGRYDPVESLRKMLPWLKYPNVHLALDPEWRTRRPMQEIGGVAAGEINAAQQVMDDYLAEQGLPGERMLVIHQFNPRMITAREQVTSAFPRVRLVHCADGFGSPALKRQSYAGNAAAGNIPIKGFKLFYNFRIPGAGIDSPLLTPQEVYALTPRPYVIMYQ